jgi:hypothetical protein
VDAESELKKFRELSAKVPGDRLYDPLNKAASVLKVHENLLAAAIAGSRHDRNAMIESLKGAVTAEDALNYSEPPTWYPPVRPLLGRVLLADKRVADAENVFRADLDRNPRDARALAGLRDCLQAQGRSYEAEQIDREFRAAWKSPQS